MKQFLKFIARMECTAVKPCRTLQNITLSKKLILIFFILNALPPTKFLNPLKAQDTLVCDNGGFEEDFLYYFGSFANPYRNGGDNCTPVDGSGAPLVFNSSSMPSTRRFEIVGSGADGLTGISKTKFGSKALLLNNKYGHTNSFCNGLFDVNRITKRFRVTEATKDFTVWFAVVLENPSGHNDSQPFFHIRCDLAPNYDLCFDANILTCQANYADSCQFSPIDVLNWSCHKLSIPSSYIGSIATLDITVADCGCGAHFGYAYIDGICEECSGSAIGSANLYNRVMDQTGLGIRKVSCNGDTIRICGDYDLPNICGTWSLDSFTVPGFTVYNKSINHNTKRFCFDLVALDFTSGCKDVYVLLHFRSYVNKHLRVRSNSIRICPQDFIKYEVSVTRGNCQNNNTNLIFSDDYYYTQVVLTNFEGEDWTIERQLDDPLPNETGIYEMANGNGNQTLNLGPILIQEGGWNLIVKVRHCTYIFHIDPPNFCSGCNQLAQAKIYDINCTLGNLWSYKIMIPGGSGLPGEHYKIFPDPTQRQFGVEYEFFVGAITENCIIDQINLFCSAIFDICPPKRCYGNPECDLEFYLKKLNCINNGSSYSVDLTLKGVSYPCYKAKDMFGNILQQGAYSNPVGPFSQDITLTLYACSAPFTCECPNYNCFKVTRIRKPNDCNREGFGGTSGRSREEEKLVNVAPNPLVQHELIFNSNMAYTQFEIFNVSGTKIYSDGFEGREYKVNLTVPPGIYFIRYQKTDGYFSIIKLLKF